METPTLFEMPPPTIATPKPAIAEKPKSKVKGYAATPGTGPSGETCKTCSHSYKRERYHKCDLIKPTRGEGTDIRLKSPACWHWKGKSV